MSILLYKCTTGALTKGIGKKFDENCTKILRAVVNKFWKQLSQQLYSSIPHISKTTQVRQTKHAGHCWRSKNEIISDVLQWTPSHWHASVARPRTYLQQPCIDAGCRLEFMPVAMDDRDDWQERVREICASCAAWRWWYEVHTISFQTFFLWAFKIVVDSWKFSMLLQYILWDDWPIFRISAINEQLQQQSEYPLQKPDCHSWWISKMQSGREKNDMQ